MRKSALLLLIFFCLVTCVSFVQADQPVPFEPPGNVTGNYTYQQGGDTWNVNTNFPTSSQDVVYPTWLFGLIIVFMVITIYFGLVFISTDPAPWVAVIACGVFVFGLGLTAAMMAPLVGSITTFQQVDTSGTATGANTVHISTLINYTMSPWISYACYGIAVGGGLLFIIAGFLLQMKEARRRANEAQAEKIMGGEIDFRQREKRSRDR
jgi:hypothetical protein